MSSWTKQIELKLRNDLNKLCSTKHEHKKENQNENLKENIKPETKTLENNCKNGNKNEEFPHELDCNPDAQQIENLLTVHLQEQNYDVQLEKVCEISRRLSFHHNLSFEIYLAALKILSADWDSLSHGDSIKDLFKLFDHDNDGAIDPQDKDVAVRTFFFPYLVHEVYSEVCQISSSENVIYLEDFQKEVLKLSHNELTVSEMKHLIDKTGMERETIVNLYNQYAQNKDGGKDEQLELERFISMMQSQLPASGPCQHNERCKHLYRVFSGRKAKGEAAGLSFKQLLLCLKLLKANTLEQILDQETLKILFRLHDIDGNGWISWEEGQEMYSVLDFVDWVDLVGVKIWWSLFDEDMDDKITLQEFLSGCSKIVDMFCSEDKIME